MRILIVDDEVTALDILERALVRAGHEITVAHNGREALEILRSECYRMVVSDWVMPEMDGLELCRQIRNTETGPYIYVLLLTCRGETSDIVEGLTAGADGFLTKPFDPRELSVRVRAGERILALDDHDVKTFDVARLSAWFGVPGGTLHATSSFGSNDVQIKGRVGFGVTPGNDRAGTVTAARVGSSTSVINSKRGS